MRGSAVGQPILHDRLGYTDSGMLRQMQLAHDADNFPALGFALAKVFETDDSRPELPTIALPAQLGQSIIERGQLFYGRTFVLGVCYKSAENDHEAKDRFPHSGSIGISVASSEQEDSISCLLCSLSLPAVHPH